MERESYATVMISVHCASMLSHGNHLKKYLMERGYKVFLCDQIIVGDNFRRAICLNASQCLIFIPFVNEGWCKSPECAYEFNIALSHHNSTGSPSILPIYLESFTWFRENVRTYPVVYSMTCNYQGFGVSPGELGKDLWDKVLLTLEEREIPLSRKPDPELRVSSDTAKISDLLTNNVPESPTLPRPSPEEPPAPSVLRALKKTQTQDSTPAPPVSSTKVLEPIKVQDATPTLSNKAQELSPSPAEIKEKHAKPSLAPEPILVVVPDMHESPAEAEEKPAKHMAGSVKVGPKLPGPTKERPPDSVAKLGASDLKKKFELTETGTSPKTLAPGSIKVRARTPEPAKRAVPAEKLATYSTEQKSPRHGYQRPSGNSARWPPQHFNRGPQAAEPIQGTTEGTKRKNFGQRKNDGKISIDTALAQKLSGLKDELKIPYLENLKIHESSSPSTPKTPIAPPTTPVTPNPAGILFPQFPISTPTAESKPSATLPPPVYNPESTPTIPTHTIPSLDAPAPSSPSQSSNPRLFRALWAQNTDALNQVLAASSDSAIVNSLSDDGLTPLYVAAHLGYLAGVIALTRRGAELDARTKAGETALFAAAQRGHALIVGHLAEMGADCSVEVGRMCVTPLMQACTGGHMEVVHVLLRFGARVDAQERQFGMTALCIAVAGGHLQIVYELLKNDADPNIKTWDSSTALLIAAANGHADIVRELCLKNADPQVKDKDGETALHRAVLGGFVDTVFALLYVPASIDLDARNHADASPFFIACALGNLELVKIFIEANVDINITTRHRETPLSIALNYAKLDVVLELLQNNVAHKIDPDYVDAIITGKCGNRLGESLQQHWFQCMTCCGISNIKCCLSCSIKFHQGHTVQYITSGTDTCMQSGIHK